MSRVMVLLVAGLGALLGMLAGLAFPALGISGVATGDRAMIESVVHDYILAHPDILPQAMQKMQDRETADRQSAAAKVADANRKAIETPFAGAWAGSAQPDVTVVEYFDYNCGYCRASLPTIQALLKSDPKIRIVFRDWPILDPATSTAAARMSLAAAAQGRFQPFHDALYAAGPVSEETIAAAAKAAGVDVARAAAAQSRADAEIAANQAMARKLGLTGTPSWVIGRKVVSSVLPLADLQKAIAGVRAGR